VTVFARIVPLARLGKAGCEYTYRVPASLQSLIQRGQLVRIPFATRELQGAVLQLDDVEVGTEAPSMVTEVGHHMQRHQFTSSPPAGEEMGDERLRDIREILDSEPVLVPHQIELARWIAVEYAAPLADVISAMLPPGLLRQGTYVYERRAHYNHEVDLLPLDQRRMLSAICAHGRIEHKQLARLLPDINVKRTASALLRAGLIIRTAELRPRRVTPRRVRHFALTAAGRVALETGDDLARAPHQRLVLQTLATVSESMSASELCRLVPRAGNVLKALIKRGLVTVEERSELRDPFRNRTYHDSGPLILSAAQQAAYEAIVAALDTQRPTVFLLHGVTGSGKTEVYMQVIAHLLEQKKQAIVMVPEISLTPQALARFAGRFPGRVAVLHSRLSPGERLDEWERIRCGEVDIVVGPRSALFAPLPRLGLIVVDEEHDPSYKQDASPRYHARDAAVHLGRQLGIPVILGSATPDVATYYAARKGRFHLLELPSRPVWQLQADSQAQRTKTATATHPHQEARSMPTVQIVDLRQELKAGNRAIFSRPLIKALGETLAAGHQALLFLNRRGSATIVVCRDCGFVVGCPDCDIPLTYHASFTQLICHRCERRSRTPRTCPACGSSRIRYLGVGTERVEEETRRLFPNARVQRWDRDVTGTKGAHEYILDRFARHEADVLVGTQMIAKGLDFPLVTLVGVVSADIGLYLPDFRAAERTFQLLAQVAGRAGRADLPSRVIVQTYTPDHYTILAAKDHDYWSFYRQEMAFRHAAGYPPYSRLLRLLTRGPYYASVRRQAYELGSVLRTAIQSRQLVATEVIGPAPAFVTKIKGIYQWQLLVRGPMIHSLLDLVPDDWIIDVDPVDLL
jgi:primosomal protein N' (replication factor Y)